MSLPWHLYVMALLYVVAGINHFKNPRAYLKIIPPYFSNPKQINWLSGLAEIILGIALCIPLLSKFAAWGIILLLIFIFPANLHMYQNDNASLGLPKWMRLLRLPLQLVLMLWAFQYT
jgi:uncharacterized membrane protein